MFLMMFRVPQSCFGAALTWSSGKGRTLGTQRIHGEILEHIMQFYQGKDAEVADGLSINPSTCQKDVFPKILYEQVCVGGEGKNVVDDNTNHQGSRMVFLIMNLIDILEELRILMMITTHLSRDFMKM